MQLIKQISQWLFPHCCVLCRNSGQLARDLCAACEADLPWILNCCGQCAMPLNHTRESLLCGACLKKPPLYDKTLTLFHYHTPISKLIVNLKFHNKLIYAKLLGELLSTLVAKHYQIENLPQLIIPVPLHTKRLKERGFNQALEIARPIAKKFNIVLDMESCKRIRHTQAQSSIPAAERRGNIKNAFIIEKKWLTNHVAIVDDVVTTGHTVNELSRALRNAGVNKIDVWCCARTTREV